MSRRQLVEFDIAYIKDGISSEHCLADDEADVIRRMAGKMEDMA